MNKLKWTPLEESIGILVSLYISINQKFYSIIYYEDNLSNDSFNFQQANLPTKDENEIDTAIIDALRFQILLETCSFLEEWDKFTGIKTDSEFATKIRIVKRVVKSAKKAINQFPDIKKFRNEIIAHNYRNKQNEFTLNNIAVYDIPNSISEIFIVVYALERMIGVLTTNFNDEYSNASSIILNEFGQKPKTKRSLTEKEVRSIIDQIEAGIDDKIFDIPRHDIVTSIEKAINSRK